MLCARFIRSLSEWRSQGAVRDTEQASSSIFQMGKVQPRSEGELVWGGLAHGDTRPPVQLLICPFFQCLMFLPAQS